MALVRPFDDGAFEGRLPVEKPLVENGVRFAHENGERPYAGALVHVGEGAVFEYQAALCEKPRGKGARTRVVRARLFAAQGRNVEENAADVVFGVRKTAHRELRVGDEQTMKARFEVPEGRPGKFRFDARKLERHGAARAAERDVSEFDHRTDHPEGALDGRGVERDSGRGGNRRRDVFPVVVELRRDEPTGAENDKTRNEINRCEDLNEHATETLRERFRTAFGGAPISTVVSSHDEACRETEVPLANTVTRTATTNAQRM